ncbi:MAG: hypothetical protein MUQ32_01680 [Chloroflexi bacterium]|nr:hypothetical protein [Chloroflexota bacterium]
MRNDFLLLVAAYQDGDVAQAEFDALAEKVRANEVAVEGAAHGAAG